MDIRNYFSTGKLSSGHNTRKQTSNGGSNDKTEQSIKSKKAKVSDEPTKKRRRVAYISDSSEDDGDVKVVGQTPSPKKNTKAGVSSPSVRSSPRKTPSSKTLAKQEKKPENRVKSSAADFFGTQKVSSGSTTTPKPTISGKLGNEAAKAASRKTRTSLSKVNAKVNKEEIVILDSDNAWSDEESFAQLIDPADKSEEHKDKDFNKTLSQLDKNTSASNTPTKTVGQESRITRGTPSKSTPPKVNTDPRSDTTSVSQERITRGTPSKDTASKGNKHSRSDAKPKTPAKSHSNSPTKVKQKYKPLPITTEKREGKADKSSSLKRSPDDTPRTKARKIQEVTPDAKEQMTSTESKPETPRKVKKISTTSLSGKTFVLTGQLENMERDAAKELVVKRGGRVVSAVSGKVNYLVAGEEAGESKMAKAEKVKGLKIINESEFCDLLGVSSDDPVGEEMETPMEIEPAKPPKSFSPAKSVSTKTEINTPSKSETSHSGPGTSTLRDTSGDLLWVEKYKPVAMNKIIGQNGDKSNAKKLLSWLNNWHQHRKLGTKPVSSFGGFGRGNPTGAGFRAALLSGPPGIGKTTSAVLVCKEAGFTFFETNASDARNKKIIHETVGQALGNTTLMDYRGGRLDNKANSLKHCIIMDEVDGMAGNEDRGGIQEFIQLLKNSHIPVICICNDRQNQKIRSLANHCFDLRFQKPRVEQIKAAMMSVCFKEGIDIDSSSLNNIIEASNHDIRQILHNLSVWSASNKSLASGQVKDDSNKAKKDFKIDTFTACRMAFNESETSSMSLNERAGLFFYDYSIHPLFIQENYIHAAPHASKGNNGDKLKRLAKASNYIAMGDIVNKAIRSDNWGLLPMQAMFSSVMPCEAVMGHLSKQIDFPKWLGKYSTTNKNARMNKQLAMHMGLSVTGSAQHICLDYLPILRDRLTVPLVEEEEAAEGVNQVVRLMEQYDLLKDDYDNIMELTQWPGQRDFRSLIESKTKAALTRQYNKSSHKLHYAVDAAPIRKRRAQASAEPDAVEEEEAVTDYDSDEEVVKALKVQPKKSTAIGKAPASQSKTTSKSKTTSERKPRKRK